MNVKTRTAKSFLAMSLIVTTAMCAERVVTASPSSPPVAELASRLIQRLSGTLRRVVAAVPVCPPRRQEHSTSAQAPPKRVIEIEPRQILLSPFHFRLPPPVA
jgi:hypothetical protein